MKKIIKETTNIFGTSYPVTVKTLEKPRKLSADVIEMLAETNRHLREGRPLPK